MAKIFLCGPGGSGKTTMTEKLKGIEAFNDFEYIAEVARDLMKAKKLNCKDLQSFDVKQFVCFQEEVLNAQCDAEEREFVHDNVLSDRSVLDCLAYTWWKTQEEFGNKKLEEMISKNWIQINEAIRRYKMSLFILVYPWSNKHSSDDGIRLSMSEQDCISFTSLLKSLLERFEIAYIDLKETGLSERLLIVESAVKRMNTS